MHQKLQYSRYRSGSVQFICTILLPLVSFWVQTLKVHSLSDLQSESQLHESEIII